jgi:hypothetical protein
MLLLYPHNPCNQWDNYWKIDQYNYMCSQFMWLSVFWPQHPPPPSRRVQISCGTREQLNLLFKFISKVYQHRFGDNRNRIAFGYNTGDSPLLPYDAMSLSLETPKVLSSCQGRRGPIFFRSTPAPTSVPWSQLTAHLVEALCYKLEVAGSIPDGIIDVYHWHNPTGQTMGLGWLSL